jgi:hypothetical protein
MGIEVLRIEEVAQEAMEVKKMMTRTRKKVQLVSGVRT